LAKRVIEQNFPLEEISKASRHEKSVRHGHPSTLHLWWARRPLASSRATLLASLVDNPKSKLEREKIQVLLSDISHWHNVKTPENPVIEKGKRLIKTQWRKAPPKVLDPFSGGGSIPLEASRLGCETYASDLNPIAVLISKATLEWPQLNKIPDLATMVSKWAKIVRNKVYSDLGKFYPHDPGGNIPVGYLWARTIRCTNPSCTTEIPLIKHFWLARTKKRRIAYKPTKSQIFKGKVKFEIQIDNEIDFDPSEGTISRATVRCISCEEVISPKMLKEFAKLGKIKEQMTIVILRSPKKPKKIYRIATEDDLVIYEKAEKYLHDKLNTDKEFSELIPNEHLPPVGTLGMGVQNYGLILWKDLFNKRQLLSLMYFLKAIREISQEVAKSVKEISLDHSTQKEQVNIILAYLAIILGRLVDKCSNLVIYNSYGEKIEHVFGRTALPMAWDYVELNVFSGANGDWGKQTEWVTRFLQNNTWKQSANVKINQASATQLPHPDNYFDAVVTDPPYYDNVPYADLSDFFYVWFKRTVGESFPNLFLTPLTPKKLEIVANKGRQKNPKQYFETLLKQAFHEIYRVLKPDGIAIFVYAHKSITGWESMLDSLIQAGFTITSSWPINTEMKTRLRARTSAALASSIYLVCRKNQQQPHGYIRDIAVDLEANMQKNLSRYWDDGIRGSDFFISSIGPGMEVFSRYETIFRFSGEIFSVTDQLLEIRKLSTQFLFNMILDSKGEIEIDNTAQFYLAYRWAYGETRRDYGEVQKIAQAYGIDLKQYSGDNGFIEQVGSTITLKSAIQRTKFKTGSSHFIDILHRIIIAWKENNRKELDFQFSENIKSVKSIFEPFCQAIAESLPDSSQEKKLLEGLLVSRYFSN
jgi:adenine-specific DNA methylase